MKSILTFVSTTDWQYFNTAGAIRELTKMIESLEKDERTYLVTIEEVDEIY